MTQNLTIHISNEMADALKLIAKSEDATIGEIIRDAVRRDMRRRVLLHRAPETPRRDLTPLRTLLQPDFERAQSWSHLQSRLMDKGYRLLQGRGDLMLHRTSGERICRLSELGHNQVALARQFHSSFAAFQSGVDGPEALAG